MPCARTCVKCSVRPYSAESLPILTRGSLPLVNGQLPAVLLEIVAHSPLLAGFCYTQFADTFQEANGLLRADRTPKIPLARIAECTTASRMHIRGGV